MVHFIMFNRFIRMVRWMYDCQRFQIDRITYCYPAVKAFRIDYTDTNVGVINTWCAVAEVDAIKVSNPVRTE